MENNNTQTAVEWLVEQIRNNKFVKASEQIEIIEQAKQMEEQRIQQELENLKTLKHGKNGKTDSSRYFI
jgi:hypothetical protein